MRFTNRQYPTSGQRIVAIIVDSVTNTVADHSQIPNQPTILHGVAKGKYHSKIDLSDAYFQTRVHPDDVKI